MSVLRLELPTFITRQVTSKKACITFNPPASYLILRNRGDDEQGATIELSLEDPVSVDTFQLQLGDREKFGPSTYKKLCYRRSDESDTKVRLDVHAY